MSSQASILVVDDELRWLQSFNHVLTAAGYEVRAASGGEPALASVAGSLPDLILLDIRMPGMDGFEVLRTLKAREESRAVPIILISAFAEVEERIEGLKLGAVDSVTKPFHAGELLARVRMQVEMSRLRALHERHDAALKSANEKLHSENTRWQQAEEALPQRLLTQPLDSPAEIRFSDLFDLGKIQRLQDQFSSATGVASIIAGPDGTPITAPSHFCRLCGIIRETEIGRRNCYQSDAVLGAPGPAGPTIRPCLSGGLWDAGASITVGGRHVASWLIGQVRNEAQDEERVLEYAAEIGVDREMFRRALAEVPVMSRERFEKTADLLFSFAHELSERASQNVQQARFIAERQQAEAALRESREGLAVTLHSIGDGVIATDADGRITRMNPTAERLTGWTFAEAAGRPMREVFHIVNARTRQPIEDPVQQVFASGKEIGLANHTVLLARDGREYQVADSAAPIRNSSGEILGVVLVFSDETERYEAREALRRSEQEYRALFEGMLEGFALHEILCDDSGRPVDYRFLTINPAFEKMTGIPAEDAIGRTVREIVPGIEPVWIERYGRVALTGEPAHFEERSGSLGRDFRVSAYPSSQPGRFAVVFEDITERKAAEARIARLTQLYAALSQCNQSIVHSTSLEELLSKICRDVVEFGGMKMAWIGLVDEESGLVCPVASHGSGREYLEGIQISTDVREVTGRGPTGSAVRTNEPVWCQDYQNDTSTEPWHEQGEYYGWKASAALPLRRGKKTIGALSICSDKVDAFDEDARGLLEEMADDISFAFDSFANEAERKKVEVELKEKNRHLKEAISHAEQLAVEAQSAGRAKSEFLALMSHELRTPLNGVLGFAELLSGTRLDEEQKEFTRTILDSGTHLLDLVNDILDFSSIEKGHMQIEAVPVPIATLVESACHPIRKMAKDKGLEFRCTTVGDVPQEITGDIRRIRQILINLLGNAVKFTRQGSVVLEISPAFLEDRPALDFSVEDTGPGIPPEMFGYLFKPFTQADSTVSRQFEGTGLGLAISLRLAEAMGGTLDVASTPGKGSRFTFRLPLGTSSPTPHGGRTGVPPVCGDTLPVAGVRAPTGRTPAPPEGSLIFVVEDDSSNRILAGKMLGYLGYQVEFAANGQEALDAFIPEKFSAILMDMQMPVMDGLEATRRIRERESGARVPIIALTANVMPGDRERCLGAGMDEFLTKPFKLRDLSGMLTRFLHC